MIESRAQARPRSLASVPRAALAPHPRLAFALLLGAILGGTALPPTPALSDWQAFTAAQDGLAANTVLCLDEHADGAIWFGTPGGASRYDGLRWSTLADSLPNLIVLALLEDRRGRAWFGTATGGLARFDGVRWERFDAASGHLPTSSVQALLEDRRGDVWIGTSGGLVRFEPDAERWTTFLPSPGGLIHASAWRLLEDRDQNLWIGTPEGASRLDAARATWSSWTQDPLTLGRDSVLALGEGPDGSVWFGTDLGAWRRTPAGDWSSLRVADGLRSPPVLAIARDSLGRMWFGGPTGVARFDGRMVRADMQTHDGRFIGEVLALRVDHSGNVWIGTGANGALRYDGIAFRHYFSSSTSCPSRTSPNVPFLRLLGSNCITAMLQDRRGELWFGTYDGGTSRLNRAGVWSWVRRTAQAPVSDSITALAEDAEGGLWFGSLRSGVARWDSSRTQWLLHRRVGGLASDSVRALYVDASGAVWVGTANGASRWTGSAWEHWLQGGVDGVPVEVLGFLEDLGGRMWLRTSIALFSVDAGRTGLTRWQAPGGPPGDVVHAMVAGRDGSLWFGGSRGLARFHEASGGEWTHWNSFGTPGDSVVKALYEDAEGGLWVGTRFSAARWSGQAWTYFDQAQLGSTPVEGVFQDAGGTMWLATFGGLSRWNGDEWSTYDSRDGLAADQITGFLQDGQQRLWFASNAGLTEHEPDRVAPQSVFVNAPPRISASRTASFVFGAGYGETADLEFAVSWDQAPYSSWAAENTWSRSDIPDGLHLFQVVSRDRWRNEDPSPALHAFEVDATPPDAQIMSPAFGQPVRGRIAVTGSAADARFHGFALQARPAGAGSWTGPEVLTLATGDSPVVGDTLASWDTAALPDGDWEIRLSVGDTLGLVGTATVRLIVDNLAPFASVTSPARVVATEGGDVYTTHAEVHAYFPPNAFDADATVTIERATSGVPETLPDGAERRGDAWDIGWQDVTLVKGGVLELRPTSTDGDRLSAYVETPEGWVPLGGSQGGDRAVRLPFTSAGRYALFTAVATSSGGPGVGSLTLTPRAFAPRGSFAASEVAIGFTLGRAAPVTVKVYSRSGRLIRVVADGAPGVTGANLFRWDGRDREGATVEAGLYLVSVEALGEMRTVTLGVVR